MRKYVEYAKKIIKYYNIYYKSRWYKNRKKIILLTTPPCYMGNLGDHAQVLGIKSWIRDCFPDHSIVEYDKEEVIHQMPVITSGIREEELILLQSGGNLGDQGLWSETSRRAAIEVLPNNRIVLLPQTVWFTDTEQGNEEREKTRDIYNAHSNMTVYARDGESLRRAQELFRNCQVGLKPDPALYLHNSSFVRNLLVPKKDKKGVLIVLRNDSESIIEKNQKDRIKRLTNKSSKYYEYYNTVIENDIPRKRRKHEVEKSLKRFAKKSVVITDRFHGLIFSVITRTPCIVLENASHKLAASETWFGEVPSVRYCWNIENIPSHLETLDGKKWEMKSSWIYEQFDELADQIQAG